jgi:translocation and assembly module TamB
MSPGQIAFEDDETLLKTGTGLFELQIIDGRLLTGNLDIDLPGAGRINTVFTAPDISMGVDSKIDGRVQIELGRIEPLLNWIPQLDTIAGTVNADMRLSGTLADPRLTGHALLVHGKVEHGASGISISDITLAGAVYNFNYTEFNGSFTSGEGKGRLKASIKFDNILKPEIALEITGQNLSLINVPDMTVNADPDLRFLWHDSLLKLDGSIVIPFARISPRYLPSTSASESQDLVITNGELPPGEESFFDRSRLRLNGSVLVELGKEVSVTLDHATANLRGKATFNWDDNLLPIADGTYTLSGEVFAYGQLLEVADGRVSFPRVPADNPELNVNAEREIYGNVQVKQAGVHITGTLKRPVLEPYTAPVTTRERALTLLVTGHDFDYEQGVGGVEVGMYIAPRLYVSYGLGLFETQSVISARYDLKNGFGIKATSGQRETGADISYTIER